MLSRFGDKKVDRAWLESNFPCMMAFYGKYACQSCHILDPDKDKGYIGPTLTQTGARLNAAWIFHWLKNAESLRPGTLGPLWKMSDEDGRAVSAFLVAQKTARKEAAKK